MEIIYNGYSNASGVYHISNKINRRIYIGSAKSFKVRYQQHIKSLEKGTHHNKFLQHDFNKCGTDAFVFEVLEVVEGEQADRLLVEQKYVDIYHDNQDSCYNFKKQAKADNRSCYSKTPEETLLLISKNSKIYWSNKQSKIKHSTFMKSWWNNIDNKKLTSEKQLGRKCPQKTIEHISNLNKDKKGMQHPKFGHKHSDETKNKQKIGRSREVHQFDINDNLIKKFTSAKEAELITGIFRSSISRCCTGKIPFAGGFKWTFSLIKES